MTRFCMIAEKLRNQTRVHLSRGFFYFICCSMRNRNDIEYLFVRFLIVFLQKLKELVV